MNLRVLFLVFLCFFSISIVSNAAISTANATTESGHEAFTYTSPTSYLTNNGTKPAGDPGGPGWPN